MHGSTSELNKAEGSGRMREVVEDASRVAARLGRTGVVTRVGFRELSEMEQARFLRDLQRIRGWASSCIAKLREEEHRCHWAN